MVDQVIARVGGALVAAMSIVRHLIDRRAVRRRCGHHIVSTTPDGSVVMKSAADRGQPVALAARVRIAQADMQSPTDGKSALASRQT
jgi:hypothetical protein